MESLHMLMKGVELLFAAQQMPLFAPSSPAMYDIMSCSIACGSTHHESAGVSVHGAVAYLCICLSICLLLCLSDYQFACMHAHLPDYLSMIACPACPICLLV